MRSESAPGMAGWMRAALLASVALVLLSCAAKQEVTTQPPPVPPPAPEPVPPAAPEPDALYERLADSRRSYQAGIELIAAGDEVSGEQFITEATASIRDAAEACAANPACDLARFFDAFDELLGEQSLMLKRQAFRIEELEAAIVEDEEREPGTSPFVASLPELDRTVSLLRGTDLRDLISLNGPVNAAIDDWLTWMRPMLMTAHHNYQFLRAEIAPIYEEAGLPEALLFAMVATESGGKVHAHSRAGAAGLLQFMRYTGRRYGLTVEDGFDMRLDPASATRANVAYLNDQFEVLNDSLEKALAAYNGGERRMENLNRRYGGTSFWDSRIYYSLPRETREYVPRVLAAAWLFLHPEDYNLDFPELDTTIAELEVREPIALGELSVCLGQELSPDGWFRVLRNLNPRLGPGERVEAGETIRVPEQLLPVYEERCASGEVLERARTLHDANYPDEPEMIVYTVRRGDTLGRIASRFRCASVGVIAEINNVRAPRYIINVGQQLKIPQCP